MKEQTNELKPCPFCGGKAELMQWKTQEWDERRELQEVICTQCYARSNPYMPPEAVKHWNRRAYE